MSRTILLLYLIIFLALVTMVVMILKNLTKIIMMVLYRRYYYQLWPIVSESPQLLNVAFPDFSVRYYVMSFPKGATITLKGTIPSSLRFWSVTLYDTTGTSIQSWNDTLYPNSTYDIRFTTTQMCAMIVRYYTTTTTSSDFLPTVAVAGRGSLSTVSNTRVTANSDQLQSLLYKSCKRQAKKYNFKNVDTYQFFLGDPGSMQMMFPNSNAMYLLAFPTSTNVIKIKGVLPPSIGRTHNVRFVGFMASDLNTTRTDDSIGDSKLSTNYILYVAFSKKDAAKYGYKEGDPILLWDKSTNTRPVVIYRQVQIDQSGLFTLSDAASNINGLAIKTIMGSYYPTIM